MTSNLYSQPQLASTAFVAPGVDLEDNVCIESHAVVLGHDGPQGPRTLVQSGAHIGANATVTAGQTIGMRARILPGSVVTRSIPPLAIVEGNPARIVGYVETADGRDSASPAGASEPLSMGTSVRGVTLHTMPLVTDVRGSLSAGEFLRNIPMRPQRYFLVFDVPTAETRGEHAHLECEQFLVAVKGQVAVVADDGTNREEFLLDRPQLGIFLPSLTWGIQYRYAADAALLVFASHYYDPDDYIREYPTFLRVVRQRSGRQ